MRDQLLKLREELEGIAGQWDGDKPGLQEERSTAAAEGVRLTDKLIELVDELSLNPND
jgi:hypothetical protein